MKPYGFSRTYEMCRVLRAGHGRKIKVAVHVKNRKRDRQAKIDTED